MTDCEGQVWHRRLVDSGPGWYKARLREAAQA